MNIDAAWNFSKPDESETRFRDLLTQTTDNENKAEVLTQLARTRGLQRAFDDAHTILDEAHILLTDDMKRVRVRYLLERGRTYNSSNVKDKARDHFLDAYNLAQEVGDDNLTVDAAHMMGIVEKDAEALKWNEMAIAHAEASSNEKARGWLGSLLNNTGWSYFDLVNYDKALYLFEKSLAWRTEMKHEEGARIARWTIARTYRALNRLTEALKMQQELEQAYAEAKAEDQGYVSEELGECLLELGRKEESKPYFAAAYEKLSRNEWMRADEPARLERILELSQ